jgi:hypothetical protein
MGETRVDLQHLLEDLRDAYPGSLEETILTEVVANALDSGATEIAFSTDPAASRITIADNGAGMSRSVLRRYHDVAASTKSRGEGIGFAGVGIKLGLLVAAEVVTETRRGHTHVATAWHLSTRKRAPWRWIDPPGRVGARGTAVNFKLHNPLSPLLDDSFVAATVQRHFAPLLDDDFREVLSARYPEGVRFTVNGARVRAGAAADGRVPLALRVGRKRKPGAVGYLLRADDPLSEDQRGIAVSSLGKVIKQGWDWLGLSPADAERIGGLVEVPALAECLTLNKADFLRTGARAASYLLYRRALQEAVSAQLTAWGAEGEEPADARQRRRVRPIERDMQTVLVDLAEEFPLLSSLVQRQPGGQKRLPVDGPGPGPGSSSDAAPHTGEPEIGPAPIEPTAPDAESPASATGEDAAGSPPPPPPTPVSPGGSRGPKRPTRFGLSIQFERRPDDPAPGRLVESTVWVNEAHPAFVRAAASRSEGYHLAITVALVLAPLAVEPAQAHSFISAFLTHWGEALDRSGRRRR